MQRITFPDGSGTITLPSDWQLTSAQRAATEAAGPNGEGVALGITMPIGPPEIAAPGVLAGRTCCPPSFRLCHSTGWPALGLTGGANARRAADGPAHRWWSSGVPPGEMNRRTEQALMTIKETNAIMRGAIDDRKRSEPRQNELRGELLQGNTVIECLRTKERRQVTVAQMNAIFEAKPGERREVPTHER